jgi:hypothetical protein
MGSKELLPRGYKSRFSDKFLAILRTGATAENPFGKSVKGTSLLGFPAKISAGKIKKIMFFGRNRI